MLALGLAPYGDRSAAASFLQDVASHISWFAKSCMLVMLKCTLRLYSPPNVPSLSSRILSAQWAALDGIQQRH
jgi:hypothetical protein